MSLRPSRPSAALPLRFLVLGLLTAALIYATKLSR